MASRARPKPWLADQLALLRERYPTTPAKTLATAIGHSAASVITKAKQIGLKKIGRQPRKRWADTELEQLRVLYPDTKSELIAKSLKRSLAQIYNKAHQLGLAKSEAYLASPAACRLRRANNPGIAFRFTKGHVPANKGLRRPGWGPGRMRETQFKKGQMAGAAARKWVPVGTEVVDDEGYLKRKISDDRAKLSRFNWRYVHVLLWEQAYGLVPPGYAVKFIDGDRRNVVLGNLCLVSRADLARLNGMWNRYPHALCRVIQLRGAINRQINRRTRREE